MSLRQLLFFLLVGPVTQLQAGTADPNDCNVTDFPKIGYYDYRDNSRRALERRKLVEGAHFTRGVQRGLYGNTGKLIDDVNYVLRHIPNHPQALLLMYEIQTRPGFRRNKQGRTDYYYDSVSCYFKRAMFIAPDDPAVYLTRAVIAHRDNNFKDAEADYLKALELNEKHAEAHYNLGLLYFSQKKYAQSRQHADKAYDLGYPLQGLKRKLAAVK
ncbi:tetratricopeptide repeat protein [Motiliproteus sp.]|uniref:tetratricopeptide repeat protein n=1 Tax=Motiliproteus sp. TaxID=1898955 RepID=UPI003BACBB5C